MKGIWQLAIVSASVLACGRQQARIRTAPLPASLVTVDELRRHLAVDSVELMIIDGVPRDDAALDTLPPAEVISAWLAMASDCRNGGTADCRALVVERCLSDEDRRSRAECPWVVSQPWDHRLRSQ